MGSFLYGSLETPSGFGEMQEMEGERCQDSRRSAYLGIYHAAVRSGQQHLLSRCPHHHHQSASKRGHAPHGMCKAGTNLSRTQLLGGAACMHSGRRDRGPPASSSATRRPPAYFPRDHFAVFLHALPSRALTRSPAARACMPCGRWCPPGTGVNKTPPSPGPSCSPSIARQCQCQCQRQPTQAVADAVMAPNLRDPAHHPASSRIWHSGRARATDSPASLVPGY